VKLNIFCVLITLFILPTSSLFAQKAGKYKIKGQIVDSSTGAGLEYASVSVIHLPDSAFAGGTITDLSGNFELDLTGAGQYLLRYDFMGYKAKQSEVVELTKANPVNTVNKVELDPNVELLEEAVVEAERSQVSMSLEKKTFEVGSDLSSIGGDATSILENVPSVTVDAEGNVSLRGNGNVRILIDGRQSGLVAMSAEDALRMIPADQIERVEVITNPSARYDAQGMAGIINIITKKEKKSGTNGSITLNAGVPRNYQASLNLNHRTGNWNFFGGYNYRDGSHRGYEDQDRTTFYDDSISQVIQAEHRLRSRVSHNIQGGVEYMAGKHNIITLNGSYRINDGLNENDVTYRFEDGYDNPYAYASRDNEEEEDRVSTDWSMNYMRTFEKKDRKLTADLSYTTSFETEITNAIQQGVTDNGSPDPNAETNQITDNEENLRNIVFQADYVDPMGKNGKFEAGVKTSFRTIDSDYEVSEQLSGSNDFTPVPEYTNHVIYDESILAAYLMYSKEWDKISFAAGVRTEYSIINVSQEQLNSDNLKEYINPFPTAHLSYKFNEFQSIQWSYSRRINRPHFWYLNPFFSYDNPLSFRSGNPNLNPEYTDALEVAYLVFKEKWSISPSIYYRHTTDVIQRVQYVEEGVTISRPENANQRSDYGLEVTGNYNAFKWWSLNGTVNLYGSRLDGTNITNGSERDYVSMTFQASSMMRFPKLFNFQVRANYTAPYETAQGRDNGLFYGSIALTREFMKKKATVSVKVQDFTNSVHRSEYYGSNFETYQQGQWRPRMFIFGFTYRLNANERDRPQRGNMNGGGGDFQD
tara:strand:- start:1643 stop:4084 length:2442 start_codon:yes stop_codon:yes gene_type:complete